MPESSPFDLDAAAAEVTRHPFSFRWGGQDWTLINAFKLDVRLIEKAMSGQLDIIWDAIRQGLGDQWEAFDAQPKKLDLDAVKILFDTWTDHAGLDPGESSGSSDSSGSTAEPSKPTSTSTTASDSTGPSSAPTTSD